jgi:YD repeat-containing protein
MGTWNFTYDAVDRLTTAQNSAATALAPQYAGKIRLLELTIPTATGPGGYVEHGVQCESHAADVGHLQPGQQPDQSADTNLRTANFVYDASGNTQNDGVNNYWYDAEGQLCAVQRAIGGTITQYIYDAEGARIGKGTLSTAPARAHYCHLRSATSGSGFTLTTRWLVGLGGDQVTELNSAGNWAHSNIFAGGKLTATYDTKGIHFELTDPLGTKRVQANASGQVDEYCTSLPFGNDLGNPLGVNCCATNASHQSTTPPSTTSPAKNAIPNQATTTSGLGTTRGAMASVARNIQKWDKGDAFLPGLVMLAPNALSNMRISQTLSELGAPAQQVPAYREMQQNTYNYFNSGARSFQQAITPTTK